MGANKSKQRHEVFVEGSIAENSRSVGNWTQSSSQSDGVPCRDNQSGFNLFYSNSYDKQGNSSNQGPEHKIQKEIELSKNR